MKGGKIEKTKERNAGPKAGGAGMEGEKRETR